jgi:hypothetical protein
MTSLRTRAALVVLALAAGLAHIPVTAEHLEEAPYMGWAFILFTAGCAVLAGAVLARGSRGTVLAMVVWCGAALGAYAATRLVAFPLLADDVGNWAETWGVVSVSLEALVVAVGLNAVRPGRLTAPGPRTAGVAAHPG